MFRTTLRGPMTLAARLCAAVPKADPMTTIEHDIHTACEPDAAVRADLWTVARHLAAAGRRDLALACEARLIPDVRRGKAEPPFTGAPLPDEATIDAYRRAAAAAPLAGVRARFHDLPAVTAAVPGAAIAAAEETLDRTDDSAFRCRCH